MNDYYDVFVSHKQEDTALAKRLEQRICELNYTCWLDVQDPQLATKEPTARELATHIRDRLRQSRCLLFVQTANSVQSKWMPWELGFFDGRWGPGTVGLYVGATSSKRSIKTNAAADERAPTLTIQEYLEIYEPVTEANLPAFLKRATAAGTLANRQDVDVDRFMTLLASAVRSPLAFQFGLAQYTLGTMRGVLNTNPILAAQTDALVALLGEWRQAAERMDESTAKAAGAAQTVAVDPWASWLGAARNAHFDGAVASALGEQRFR